MRDDEDELYLEETQRKCFDALNPGDLFAFNWPLSSDPKKDIYVEHVWNGVNLTCANFFRERFQPILPEGLNLLFEDRLFVLLDKSAGRKTLRVKALDSEYGVVFIDTGAFIAEKVKAKDE